MHCLLCFCLYINIFYCDSLLLLIFIHQNIFLLFYSSLHQYITALSNVSKSYDFWSHLLVYRVCIQRQLTFFTSLAMHLWQRETSTVVHVLDTSKGTNGSITAKLASSPESSPTSCGKQLPLVITKVLMLMTHMDSDSDPKVYPRGNRVERNKVQTKCQSV